MQIKKNKKKEELRHDPVMESVEKTWAYIRENNKLITITSVVIIAVILAFSFYRRYSENRIESARKPFGKGMSAFSEERLTTAYKFFKQCEQNHSGTPQALYSQYMRAHIDILEQRYEAAEKNLRAVQDKAPASSFMKGQINESLAEVYDAMGRDKEAIAQYKKALEDDNFSYKHNSVKWNLALLNMDMENYKETRNFLNQLVSDTALDSYSKKAENLLVSMDAME